MTAISERPVRGLPRPGTSLAHVLVELGPGTLDVLHATPQGHAGPVRRVRIWDLDDEEDALAPGDLVLAVGVPSASPHLSRLLAAAAEVDDVTVAVREPGHPSSLADEAARRGTTVLTVPRSLSWDQVHGRLRAVVAGGGSGDAVVPRPSGDLYAVANTAAAALGGPVEIGDAELRPLAFSALPGSLDESRVDPRDFAIWLHDSGQLLRLRGALYPVRIDPACGPPRLIVPVRAGAALLGFVWLTEGHEPLGERQERVLGEVAGIVAAHLLRGGEPDRPPLAALLARALDGSGEVTALGTQLRLRPGTAFTVVGFRPRLPWNDPDVDPLYVRDQLELRRELDEPGAATVVGGHVYAVAAADPATPPDLVPMAEAVVASIGRRLGQQLVAVTEADAVPLAELAAVRDRLDRGLRLLAEDPARAVASSAQLRPHILLDGLRQLARERSELLDGPMRALADIDAHRRTDYLASLRAYFDAASDLSEAARILYVHRNTLRYRLGRIQELCGLDLADPVQRLVAELQLRLLDGAAPSTWEVDRRATS